MKTLRILITIMVSFALILTLASLVQAQGEEPPEGEEGGGVEVGVEIDEDPGLMVDPVVINEPIIEVEPPSGPDVPEEPADVGALLDDVITFQGRLLSASGLAITGSRSITLSLYDVASGGTALCTDTDTVTVTSGLFYFLMDWCSASDTAGQQLYLGVKVGSDLEMTPRQGIYAVPYARSLRPGALIKQTTTTLHALELESNGDGKNGTALMVTNTGAAGIGAWINADGTDTALVVGNGGTGPIFKGFGSNGGDDEFRITNGGAILSKADSFFFISGSALVKNLSTDTTRWDIQPGGAARIWRGSTAGSKIVYFPVTIPSVLYGQSVTVETITVYYVCENAANGYITATYLDKLTDADSSVSLISNLTDHTSTAAASYSISVPAADATLGSNQGVGLYLQLQFANDTDHVQIGGIRIDLGHHIY